MKDKDSFVKESTNEVIPWLARKAKTGVERSLKKVVPNGEYGTITLEDFLQAEGYSLRTNTSVRLKYNGKSNLIASHFHNLNSLNNERGYTNPRSLPQTLKKYIEVNNEELGELYQEYRQQLEFLGSPNQDVDKGLSQYDRTDEYRLLISMLHEYYWKNGEYGFTSDTEITGYLLSGGLSDNDQSINDKYKPKKYEISNMRNDNYPIKEGILPSRNVIFEGVAGCGKSHKIRSLMKDAKSDGKPIFKNHETVVFHPSTSYEDFVSGLRSDGEGGFKGSSGVFIDICNEAAKDPNNDYLLVIDEINRANTSKVFGDLLLLLEESKRVDYIEELKKGEIPLRAVFTKKEIEKFQIIDRVRLQTEVYIDGLDEPFNYLVIPKNLYIVGAMNSTDRTVGTIDLALRRRFTWETIEPFLSEEEFSEFSLKVDPELITWYLQTNIVLAKEIGPDGRLGHSYFFKERGGSGSEFSQKIYRDLLNQLVEILHSFHININQLEDIEWIYNTGIETRGKGIGERMVVVSPLDSSTMQ